MGISRAALPAVAACAVLACSAGAAHAADVPDTYAGSFKVPVVGALPALANGLDDAAWKSAAKIDVAFDLRNRRPDADPMSVYALTDGKTLAFAFDVTQHAPLTAEHRQNDAGLGNDDDVIVYLYPNGPTGFVYAFQANPLGTHTAFSSENTAYSPTWQSFGHVTDHGYVVTMGIPLQALKGGDGGVWRVNFRRDVSKTLVEEVWSYAPNAIAGNDPPSAAAGTMSGLPARTAPRPKPRIGVYGLGEMTAPRNGGNTSRVGADISLPITRTTALVSTVHPDYSNVEVDQQTIAPTAFPRFFNDVRPFFTQLQNYYNAYNCLVCTGVQPLYTTAIPTPRYGNAIEGKQGVFSFAGFDAVGNARDDNAQTLNVQTKDQRLSASLQRSAVALPGLLDRVETASASYDSQKGLVVEGIHAREQGTLVTDPAQAAWSQAGVGFYDKTQMLYASVQRIGAQFGPVDGYTPNNGLSGYAGSYFKTWYRAKEAAVPRILFYAQTDSYRSVYGGLGQSDEQIALGCDVQRFLGLGQLVHWRGQVGSSYVRLDDGNVVPVSQNGVDFTYAYRTATPLAVSYYTGRFGPARLDYWSRSASYVFRRNLTFALTADDGTQYTDDGRRFTQWLERASITWQPGSATSLVFGARRVIGTGPLLELRRPRRFADDVNLSAALYHRWPHDELYLVYGDAGQVTTARQLILKLIHYVGAEKGT